MFLDLDFGKNSDLRQIAPPDQARRQTAPIATKQISIHAF
jgi:hypothetical protein